MILYDENRLSREERFDFEAVFVSDAVSVKNKQTPVAGCGIIIIFFLFFCGELFFDGFCE